MEEEDPRRHRDLHPHRRQLHKLVNNKWVSMTASILIQCTSGSLYTFSVYSAALKATQLYSQSTLDTVSVFKDIGGSCGVLAGFLYSSAASTGHRGRGSRGGCTARARGPWVVHAAGAVQNMVGYLLMWASVTGVIGRPPVAAMCLFMFLAAHAQSFFNTADVVTSVRNFSDYSGTAVGIMKGFIGLSGAVLIQIYQSVLNERPAAFLLMLAILPSFNALLLMWFVKVYEAREAEEKRHLNAFSLIALALAAYLTVIIMLENVLTLSFLLHLLALALLLVLLFSPLIVAFRAVDSVSRYQDRMLPVESGSPTFEPNQLDCSKKLCANEERGTGSDYRSLPSDSNEEMDDDKRDSWQLGEDLNLWQAMRTAEFWILFLAMACGMGSGLATVNNISQIGGSLGYTSKEINGMISLWSIWNFLGRFGAGYVSDFFLHNGGWARPLVMAFTLAALSIGHVVIASGFPGTLYVGTFLVGVFYGSQWSLMPTIASEIFGVGHMGSIFNTITMANPVGSYIFSVRVIGYIYDKEASGKGNKCTGRHCFMSSFLIMAGATLLGALAAVVIFCRTRSLYSRIIVERIRHYQRP